jgi:hypothetical protein
MSVADANFLSGSGQQALPKIQTSTDGCSDRLHICDIALSSPDDRVSAKQEVGWVENTLV